MLIPVTQVNAAGGMALIQEQVLGSDAASIVFSAIPQSYRAIRFDWSLAGATAAKATLLHATANAYAGGTDYLYRNEGGRAYDAKWVVANLPAATMSPYFGHGFFECYGYNLARKHSMFGVFESGRIDNSGTASTDYAAGVSACTVPIDTAVAALTSFTFAAATGNLVTGSRIALWGIT